MLLGETVLRPGGRAGPQLVPSTLAFKLHKFAVECALWLVLAAAEARFDAVASEVRL